MATEHETHEKHESVTPPPAPVIKPIIPSPTPAVLAPGSAATSNGLAVAGFIVGLVAFFSGWLPFWGLLVGIAAVILSILALRKSQSKGLAVTGLVTGGLGLLSGLASILFFIFVVIAGVTSAPTINKAVDSASTYEQQQQALIDSKKDFAKGETASFNGYKVKVNSFQTGYVSSDKYDTPADGNQYVVVNLTITNDSDSQVSVSDSLLKIVNNGIAKYSSSFVAVDNELQSGSLEKGASTTGNVVYEVSNSATNLKLQYTANAYAHGQTQEIVYTLALQ